MVVFNQVFKVKRRGLDFKKTYLFPVHLIYVKIIALTLFKQTQFYWCNNALINLCCNRYYKICNSLIAKYKFIRLYIVQKYLCLSLHLCTLLRRHNRVNWCCFNYIAQNLTQGLNPEYGCNRSIYYKAFHITKYRGRKLQ